MIYETLSVSNHRCLRTEKNRERLGRMKPEAKVALALDMIDGCMRVCAEGIRNQCPDITEEELVAKLRERLEWTKRHRRQ